MIHHRAHRLLIYGLSVVYLLCLLSSFGLIFLFTTESGARWLFTQIENALPQIIQIENLKGRIIGPLELTGVHYHSDTLDLEIAKIRIHWTPTLLFQKQLLLRELQAQGVHLTLPPATKNSTPFSGFSLPIALHIEQGEVQDFRLIQDIKKPLIVERLRVSGQFVDSHILLKDTKITAFGAEIYGTGKIDLSPNIPLDVQLKWNYDLAKGVQLGGKGEVRGTLKELHLDQQLELPFLGQLNAQLFNLEKAPRWQFTLQLKHAELEPLIPQLPGRLTVACTSTGQFLKNQLTAQLNLTQLSGQLRGYPVEASGTFNWAENSLNIGQLRLKSARNQLDIQGQLGARLEVNGTLNGADLTSLWPGLAGRANAKLHLSGTRNQPHIEVQLNGKNLAYQTHLIEQLTIKANVGLGAGEKFDLTLNAEKLTLAQQNWKHLNLNLQGQRERHTLQITLESAAAPSGVIELDANFTPEQTWKGTLRRLTMHLPQQANWQLAQPSNFSFSAMQRHIYPLCLNTPFGNICAEFHQLTPRNWNAQLTAPKLSLAPLKTWLPEEWQIAGQAVLKAEVHSDAQGIIQGAAQFNVPEAILNVKTGQEKQQIRWAGTHINAELNSTEAQVTVNIPLMGIGALRSELRLPHFNLAHIESNTQVLMGTLQGKLEQLEFLSLWIPRLSNLHGHVDLNYTLSGHLATPHVHGEAQLSEGALDIPELGLQLRAMNLRLASPEASQTQDHLLLTGNVHSGEGQLNVQGKTHLNPASGFPSELKIEGKDWVIVDIPEALIRVTPQLTIQYQKGRTDLEGEIHIPYGRIRPRALPTGAVSNSSDLVMVSHKTPNSSPAIPMNFHATLRLILGDEVNFEGLGLRGRFTGQLSLHDEPGRPVFGRGRLGIIDGVYRAYGQDLKIQRGYALFADGPVDNPGLDIQATRTIDTITAGIRINGNLKTPQMSLFSTPAMTQSEIAAYLFTGAPPGKAGAGQMGLAAVLSAGGAGEIAGDLARHLGLEELRLESSGALKGAALVAGTYLAPRLYVQYVNTLASRETALRVRYELTDYLQIQTETGKAQGVDVFYTHEH